MRATIIHTPKAGRIDVVHMLPAVCSALREHGWRVKTCSAAGIGCENNLTALARSECDGEVDAIFVAGGDGSVGAVASVLSGTGVSLGILPCGTGNVWARGLGLTVPAHPWSRALVSAAVSQVEGCVRYVDLGRCNGRAFLLWAGIGLDGHIVHGIEPRGRIARKFGRWHYLFRGLLLSIIWRGTSVRILSGCREIDAEILGAVVTNVPGYAGGLATLDPYSRAESGSMTLAAFSGAGFVDSLTQMCKLISRRHHAHRNVERVVAARFVLESDVELPLQVDGEPAGTAKYFEIRVVPSTLRVFVPKWVGSTGWHSFWV